MKRTSSAVLSAACVLAILSASRAKGQTQVDLKNQSKSVDFSRATSTLPLQTGTALPSTCPVGAMYFLTSAPAGLNLFACVAANTWNVESGGALTSGAGAPSGACTLAGVYNDTVNGNTWLCENGTWQKELTTNNAGGFIMTGQTGSLPATPTTGQTALY